MSLLTIWHDEGLAERAPSANNPDVDHVRCCDPRWFRDADPRAGGYAALGAYLEPFIARALQDAHTTAGVSIGVLFRNPGGLTFEPTPERPYHFAYPDRPFHEAREAGCGKLADRAAFEAVCVRYRKQGVKSIGVYLGAPGRSRLTTDPELLDLVRREVVTHVIFDATAHQAAWPLREASMVAYESAGAVVGYEAIPNYGGPGSDLWKKRERVCVCDLAGWLRVSERETAQAPHPRRNVPVDLIERALVLDRQDNPEACRRLVAEGREVAVNLRAWASRRLADLWS